MMRPANLLPADLARGGGRQLPAPVIAAAAAGIAVVGGLAFGYTTAHNQVATKQSQLDALTAQIAAVPQPKVVHSSISQSLGAEKDARQTVLNTALSDRVAWYTVFRELSLVLPNDVWLATMSAKSSPTTDTTTGTVTNATGLTMTGYTYSQKGVARLLSRLALVPQLSSVQLQSSGNATVNGVKVVSFSIGATVNDISTGGGS